MQKSLESMQGLMDKLGNNNAIDLSVATAGDGAVQGKYRVDFEIQIGFLRDQIADERTKREAA